MIKKSIVLSMAVASLFALNPQMEKYLKGTFIEKSLHKKDENITIRAKKINKDTILLNVIDNATGKVVPLYEDINNKTFFVGQMIMPDGKVVNPLIVDKQTIDKAVAFTFGKGKKELYIVTDPQCPYCRMFAKEKGELLEKNYKVHVILFPLSLHKYAKQMSKYILAGKTDKERFERFKNVLLQKDNKWQTFKPTAKEEKQIDKELENSRKAVELLRIKGTPSVYDKDFNPINWTTIK